MSIGKYVYGRSRMICPYASSGCNYPESDCAGLCIQNCMETQPPTELPEDNAPSIELDDIARMNDMLVRALDVLKNHAHAKTIFGKNLIQACVAEITTHIDSKK